MKEKLSAFIDAELTELEERHVLMALTNDPQLRAAWERYHLIRAAMTRQLSMLAPAGLPERVLQGVGERPRERAAPRYWHYAGGAAVAAAVAAIAIVGLQSLHDPAPRAPAVARAPDAASQVAAASTVTPTPIPTPTQGLNPYLVGHSEFMPTAGMGGMLPYVRVVTLDSDQ